MFYLAYEKIRKVNYYLYFFYFFVLFFVFVPFLILLLKAFKINDGSTLSDNTVFVHTSLINSFVRSFWVAFTALILVFLVGYPFAYLVFNLKRKTLKVLVVSLVTAPLWSSFFVKLIGLKSFFDLIYGELNSTRGLIYVVIGLVYIYLPIAILNFYNVISSIPKNIINASLDLGVSRFETAFKIVIPYSKKSIIAVTFLVFLPSITTVSVADFMNYEAGNKLIAQHIHSLILQGNEESISTNRLSFVTVFVAYLMILSYLFVFIGKSVLARLEKKFKGNG